MPDASFPSPAAKAATDVILSTFRANGLLLRAGDLLGAAEGLTASRWQVLGAIALAHRALSVPQIARRMGLSRQSVHATVDRLVADGLVELMPNSDHQRSSLIGLTELGRAKYRAIDRRQKVWVARLTEGIGAPKLQTTARVLDELSRRLEVGDEKREEKLRATHKSKGGKR